VIDKQTVAGLTMQTAKTLDSGTVGRRILHDETEINRDALKTLRSTTRVVEGAGSFV
jgi:hypothetical protein